MATSRVGTPIAPKQFSGLRLLEGPVAPGARTAGIGTEDPFGYEPEPSGAGMVSCVIDSDPRFHFEALRWFAAATLVAQIQPGDLAVTVIDGARSDVTAYLQSQGVTVRSASRFDSRCPHCNKISAAVSMATSEPAGLHILSDSDVLVLSDPRDLNVPSGHVALKPVDLPNPPLHVLENVFKRAGVPIPRLVAIPGQPEAMTVAGNGNGGLYAVPGPLLTDVAEGWAFWARWLLERVDLLEAWAGHVDQVAMAVALAAEDIPTFELASEWNLPIHIDTLIPSGITEPSVIHYHSRVDQIGMVSDTGIATVDSQIAKANAALSNVWKTGFPNSTFWDWRYASNPELGSGVGSRGAALDSKRELIKSVVREVNATSVLDVGCGDGEATRDLELPNYTGLDLSRESIARASAGNPDRVYRHGTLDLNDESLKADLVLCLDVLIHQSDKATYEQLVANLVGSAARALLVTGYDAPPTADSPMIFFHEPLSQTLTRYGPTAELHALGQRHEMTTFLLRKPPAKSDRT